MSSQGGGTEHCIVEQCIWEYTLLNWLADVEAWSKPVDDAMVVDEPVKPVAGSSKHPNDVDVVDGELIY